MSVAPDLWLVMSSAYIGAELAAEFGNLPPTFLPVGMARLYDYQIARIPPGQRLYLTLPEHFRSSAEDCNRLTGLGVTMLLVPESLKLGEAIVYAINSIGEGDQPIHILHGDTLIDDIPVDLTDVLSVADATDGYSWAEVSVLNGRVASIETIGIGNRLAGTRPVATGFFAFSSSAALVRSITRARGDFIEGVNVYCSERVITLRTTTSWYDFGHAQTYFRSRRAVSTARAFNALKIDGRTARKSSLDVKKMQAEAAWLRGVPPRVQLFCVRVLDEGFDGDHAFYETEYQYLPTLAELFVFGTLSRPVWARIVESCSDFLESCVPAQRSGPRQCGNAILQRLAVDKTMKRIEAYAKQSGFDIGRDLKINGRAAPSLRKMAEELSAMVAAAPQRDVSFMHGDFCFSNILFDSRTCRIKVIDPRGFVEAEEPSLFGDLRYDLAKLSHSAIGRYDQLVAGRHRIGRHSPYEFTLEFEQSEQQRWLEPMFSELTVDGTATDSAEVSAIMTGLFVSMLPLHADRPERQQAFIANAARLYLNIEMAVA